MPRPMFKDAEFDMFKDKDMQAKKAALMSIVGRANADADKNTQVVQPQLAQEQPKREAEARQDPEVAKPNESVKPPSTARSEAATTKATLPGQQERSGFDWSRALYAMGGGNPTDIDEMRMAPLKMHEQQAKLAQFRQHQDLVAQSKDPKSRFSQQAQKEYADLMQLRSMHPGLPESHRQYFAAEAQKARGYSAEEIGRRETGHEKAMGELIKMVDADARQKLAEENMDLRRKAAAGSAANIESLAKDREADNQRQNAQLAETKRHNQATEEAAAAKSHRIQLRATSPDKKTMDAINDAKEAITNIDRALKLRSENDFYTGTGGRKIAKAQRGLEDVPIIGEMAKMDQAKQDYLTTLGSIAVPLRKAMIGTGQSGNELEAVDSFIPSEEQGKDYSITSLKNLRDRAVRTLGRAVGDYHRKVGLPYELEEGAKLEAILEAHRAAETAHNQAKTEVGEAAPAVQNEVSVSDNDRKALEWLKTHQNDPGAPAVRSVLQRKGLLQ